MNDNKKPQEASSDLPNTIIELDKKKILEEISAKGKYEENNIFISHLTITYFTLAHLT